MIPSIPPSAPAVPFAGGTTCESLGASSNATASVNLASIQAALSRTGVVTLTTPGTYYINGTLLAPSDTDFRLGAGVVIRRTQGVNASMLRNTNANSAPFNITSLTSSIDGSNGYLASVTTGTPHNMAVGSYTFVAGAQPNDYNGIWKVLSVADSMHMTLGMSYYNGTPQVSNLTSPATINTGTSGANIIGVTTTLNSGNIVLGSGTTFGWVLGQACTCTGFAGPQTITAVGANGALTLSGKATANSTAAVFQTNQYAYTSIVGMAADVNIAVQGGTWYQDFQLADGSGFYAAGVNGLTGNNTCAILLNRVRHLLVRDILFDNCYDGLVPMSAYDAVISNINSVNTGSTVQFMSGGRNITCYAIGGQTHDVTVSFLVGNWYTWAGTNFEYLTDVEALTIRDVNCQNALYAVQLSGQAGVKFREVTLDGITGTAAEGSGLINVYDDPAIGAGTYIEGLKISRVRTDGAFPWSSAMIFTGNAFLGVKPTIRGLSITDCDLFVPDSAVSSLAFAITFNGAINIPSMTIANTRFTGRAVGLSNSAINLGVNLIGTGLRLSNVEFSQVANCVVGGFASTAASYQYSNIHMSGCGALHYGMPNGSGNIYIGLNSIHVENVQNKLLYSFGNTSNGYIYVGGVNFAANMGGGWLDSSITNNSNWTAFWSNPHRNPYSIAGAGPSPDVRNGSVQAHVIAAATSMGNILGGGYPGSGLYAGGGYYPMTLILTADSSGTLAWTFQGNYALSANVGQVGQVLTPGAANAGKTMTLQFIYQGGVNGKWAQTNVGAWN
ncbi:hypothetical protein [Glaciimonas immobilis]|uniref:Uncharacterized protein n=1 Tax=Glaciimonas immobilis TaxID=728004 RepID=A0A840RW31_9BURK|nr:hypothetical protein [Glaciimonas immobilis]KAF3997543.1 hypothetical protein HAV38_12760 [Glaciimonas immobilis]MBB5200771.1 hypothetical protein [Glaciimonas immobilis]